MTSANYRMKIIHWVIPYPTFTIDMIPYPTIPYPTFFIYTIQLSDFFLIIAWHISLGIKYVLVINLAKVPAIKIWLLKSDRKISSQGHESCYLSHPNNTLSDTLPYVLHWCDTLPYDTLPYLHHWYDTLPYDTLPYVLIYAF